MFDNELCKPTNLHDGSHHPSRSKPDSQKSNQEQESQCLNKFREVIDRPDTDTVSDPPTLFAEKSNSSMYDNQPPASNRKIRPK